MFELRIRLAAKEDIDLVERYYSKISKELPIRFRKELIRNLDLIESNPHSFQLKYLETRVCYLKTFSFGIHYRIKEGIIEILAILHTNTNPQSWSKRN